MNIMPPIPQRRDEIPNLPNNYQITHRGDRFLMHDSGVGDVDRLIVFATDDAIQLLGTMVIRSWTVLSSSAQKYFFKSIQYMY